MKVALPRLEYLQLGLWKSTPGLDRKKRASYALGRESRKKRGLQASLPYTTPRSKEERKKEKNHALGRESRKKRGPQVNLPPHPTLCLDG